MSKTQVLRGYSRLYSHMCQAYPGQAFGFDQRTLALTGGQGWLDAITRLARMFERAC